MKYIFIALTLLFSDILPSQSASVKYLSVEEGLSHDFQNANSCLLEDEKGHIWIATYDGINIYDGYDLMSFNIKTSEGLIPRHKVQALGHDPLGRIWIGTVNEGIFILDPSTEQLQKFEPIGYDHISEFNSASGFFIDKYDRFLIAGLDKLIHLDIATDSMTVLYHAETGNAWMSEVFYLQDGRMVYNSYTDITIENDLGELETIANRRTIASSLLLDDGTVEFEEIDGLRFRWDPSTNKIDTISPAISTYHRRFDLDSIIFTSTYGAIAYKNTASQDSFNLTLKDRDYLMICDMIQTDPSTAYFMSSTHGAGQLKIKDHVYSEISDLTSWSLLSHKGIIYIGGETGVFRYNPLSTSQWEQIVSDDEVFAFAFTRDDQLIINQHRIYFGKTSIYSIVGTKLYDQVTTPIYDKIQQLDDGTLITDHINEFGTDIPMQFVGDLGADVRGYDSKQSRARYFMERKNGELWIITEIGDLYALTPGRDSVIHPLEPSHQESQINIQSPHYIFEDKEETVYIAAGNGLFYRKEHSSSWHQIDFGLPEEYINIRGMVEDSDAIWIMSRTLLLRLNKQAHTSSYYRIPIKFLPEGRVPQDLAIDSSRNIYYIGLNSAALKLSLSALENQESPQPVIMTNLYVDRERVRPNDPYEILDSSLFYQHSFRVPYKYRNVGLGFNCHNGQSIEASYYYRLLGLDANWKNANQERIIHFTNLNPGDYTFEVKAQSSGGKWTDEVTQLRFTVITPWYRTYWAYGIYIILCLLAAYGYYQYRIQQIMKYQRLRTKISSDLHDDVGSLLTAVAMQSEVLGLNAPPENIAKYNRLSKMSREAMGRMRDTVWAIDARKDKMESLVDRMEDYLSDLLDIDEPKLNYQFDKLKVNDAIKIAPDIRQNVYLIFKEAVNNAIKHSNGNRLHIILNQSSTILTLAVEDNGTIQSGKTSSSGLGLNNMDMRAKRIQGTLSIDQTNGFKILLKAPLR